MSIPNTGYINSGSYSIFQDDFSFNKDKDDCSSGCGSGCDDDCGCPPCPPGTVQVNDGAGKCVGCLTPSDAQIYNTYTLPCPDGFVKTFDEAGNFVGCLTVADYKTFKTP